MGILIGVGATKPIFPYDYYYGIERDITAASSACTRIGRPELHVSLPIQGKMRRCLLNDNGSVNYYLDGNNSALRDTGSAAVLDGSHGQVMVEIPEYYIKHEAEGTKIRTLVSEFALPGFRVVPKMYVSAYEATVDRTVPASIKLASVLNLTTNFRGGNNTAGWDGSYRTQLGVPVCNISISDFRSYARNRGAFGLNNSGWNCYVYDAHLSLSWLYVVEYANFNAQLSYNASPDGNGYKQGGLGEGVTTLVSATWNTYNSQCPFVPCGHTNQLGNRTGIVYYTMPAEYGSLTVGVPSYRGVENPFGHLWKWTDGVKCRILPDINGGTSEFYVSKSPEKYQTVGYDGYEARGLLSRESGYIKNIFFGEFGDVLPRETGASSSTYYTDSLSAMSSPESEQKTGVITCGHSSNGSGAGFLYCNVTYTMSVVDRKIGTRLCFFP